MVSSSHMKLLPKTVQSSDDDNEVKVSQEINGEQGRYECRQKLCGKTIASGGRLVENLVRVCVFERLWNEAELRTRRNAFYFLQIISPTAQEMNFGGYVLLQTDRYIFKASFFFFSFNKYGMVIFITFTMCIVYQGLHLTSPVETGIWGGMLS